MLIMTPTRSAKTSAEKCANRVQAVLDTFPDDEFLSQGKSKAFQDKHGWRFTDFILMALKYGMAIQTHNGSNNPKDLSAYVKTHNYPTFKVEDKPASTEKKVYKPRKPKQGDGSVLAPRFNHGISKPEDKPEIYRTERVRSSKLPIIGRNEDERAYDTNYQLERLEQIRMERL